MNRLPAWFYVAEYMYNSSECSVDEQAASLFYVGAGAEPTFLTVSR